MWLFLKTIAEFAYFKGSHWFFIQANKYATNKVEVYLTFLRNEKTRQEIKNIFVRMLRNIRGEKNRVARSNSLRGNR